MTENNKIPFGFYDIDREYIEYLQKYDDHVPKCDYEDEGRARKFYCGPVMNEYGIDYYVPISSKNRNMRLNNIETYGINMRDINTGELIGCLDFRFMIPCSNQDLITPHKPTGYAVAQDIFCQKNKSRICAEARATYNNVESKDYPFLNQTAVRQERLNDAIWAYDDILDAQKEELKKRETLIRKTEKIKNTELYFSDFDIKPDDKSMTNLIHKF